MLAFAVTGCGADGPHYKVVGTLEWDRIELVAETSEPIMEVVAQEGDALRQGDVILRLDPERLQAQLEEAKALRAEKAARLAELLRGPRPERIMESRARLAGAESAVVTAERELKRIRTLVDQKLLSPKDLDRAQSDRDEAVATRDAARAALQELERGTTDEELEQARQALAAADAALRALQVTLSRSVVRAPQAGRLDALPFKLGEHPTAGAVVAVLLAGDAPYARIYVPESLRVQVNAGTSALVYVDGLDEPFEGRVRKISRDPVFTPYYSLTERDRSRLSFVAEVGLLGEDTKKLPAGLPLTVYFNIEL